MSHKSILAILMTCLFAGSCTSKDDNKPSGGSSKPGQPGSGDGSGTSPGSGNSTPGAGNNGGMTSGNTGPISMTPNAIALTEEADTQYFTQTVHPIVVERCGQCHGDSRVVPPSFALTDANQARKNLIETGKVNFSFPNGSRIVQRLASDQHNCWGNCLDNSQEILNAVTAWINLRGRQAESEAKTSQNLKLADAETRMAQTEEGTLVMQAEQGEGNFRITVAQSSKASGAEFAQSTPPPDHPMGTEREGRVDGDCEGTYGVTELSRYPNQETGFLRYALRIHLTLLTPTGEVARDNRRRTIRIGRLTILPRNIPQEGTDAAGNALPANFYEEPRWEAPENDALHAMLRDDQKDYILERLRDRVEDRNLTGYTLTDRSVISNYIQLEFDNYQETPYRIENQQFFERPNLDPKRLYVSATGEKYLVLNDEQVQPGVLRFQFKVRSAGNYRIWAKVGGGNNSEWRVQLKDEQNGVLRSYLEEETEPKDSCLSINSNDDDWEWKPAGSRRGRSDIPHIWRLTPGIYTLEMHERRAGSGVDMVAISRIFEFNPREVLYDESQVSSYRPKILKYDISNLIEGPAALEVEVRDANEKSYHLGFPRIVDNQRNIYVQNIKPLINEVENASDAMFSLVEKVAGQNQAILKRRMMVVLKDKGPEQDTFGFRFGVINATDEAPSRREDDTPGVIENRPCLAFDLFRNKVMPIFKRFKLFRPNDYESFIRDFPGRPDRVVGRPQMYTCTGCHNAEHPLFKMSSFDDNVLCEQALSRVDFANFERSMLIRGINGSYDHPPLIFVQDARTMGDGYEMIMNNGTPVTRGEEQFYRSTWLGKFAKYATNDSIMSLDGKTEEQVTDILINRDRYKRIRFERTTNAEGESVPLTNAQGQLVYTVLAPYDFEFNDGNFEAAAEGNENFDALRAKYRNIVIQWMREEKKLFDEANE